MQESISGTAPSGPLADATPHNVAAPSAVAGLPIAPMTDRAIAAFIDLIVMCAAFPVAGMWAAVQWGGATSNGFELNGLPALFVITAVGLAGFLYLWLGEGLFGATLGKAAMSLRVRSAAGGKPGLQKSLLRNLLRIVDGIGVYVVGLAFALTSPTRQRLGDRVAGTVVVHVESRGRTRPAAAIGCVAILVASFAVAFGLHASVPATSIAAPGTPAITRAELGTGDTDDYQIVGAADTFPTSQPEIVCVFTVEGVPAGTPIRADWIAEDAGGAFPPNSLVIEKTVDSPGPAPIPGDFKLTAPPARLPPGKYRLEIYIGGSLAKTLPFTLTKSG
jgi:uncharacterized RDD family membrane protein YckC